MADEQTPDIHTFRFLALIDSLRHAATLFLGEATAPPEEGGEADPERARESLEKARHYIDFLATLQEKTRGNLSGPEESYLTDLLAALRMDYVNVAEKIGAPPEKPAGKAGEALEKDSAPGGDAEEGEDAPGDGDR